jgi:hypothetical protein
MIGGSVGDFVYLYQQGREIDLLPKWQEPIEPAFFKPPCFAWKVKDGAGPILNFPGCSSNSIADCGQKICLIT